MSTSPLVSIGCAVFNGQETLDRALKSLVGQDYQNLEIIIRDDGSTDGSVEICRRFAESDKRIQIIENSQNLGLTGNCNRLFRDSTGKYFMWADQDDVRMQSFVTMAVERLEANPDAVLCHSQTGAFVGQPEDLKTVCSLGRVVSGKSVTSRYIGFLREYSDTAIYGLLRSSTLRETGLWRSGLGSANSLLFELLLRGRFLEIPGVLYLYSARGLANRPGPAEEYSRQNRGKLMPWYYFPFLAVGLNQLKGIRKSKAGSKDKVILTFAVIGNMVLVNFAKLSYRIAYRLFAGNVPERLTQKCKAALGSTAHIVFVHGSETDDSHVPKDWALRTL